MSIQSGYEQLHLLSKSARAGRDLFNGGSHETRAFCGAMRDPPQALSLYVQTPPPDFHRADYGRADLRVEIRFQSPCPPLCRTCLRVAEARRRNARATFCLLYTSDAADE